MTKFNCQCITNNFRGDIAPFDESNSTKINLLAQSKVCHFAQAIEAIQICMKHWNLKEFSGFSSRREEGDLIDKIDFKKFFYLRKERSLGREDNFTFRVLIETKG
jgi:hypothetical protein